ncbi:MAG: YeeE/YedE thiosulfate transporter family protein [Vibrio sp.]
MFQSTFFFILCLFFAAYIGFRSSKIGLCLVRGVERASRGKPSFLFAILFSGSFSWITIILANQFETHHFTAYELTIFPFLGGTLFGIGAAFNKGCGISTLTRLVRGESVMMATVIGWFIGWVLLTPFVQTIEQQKTSYDYHTQAIFLFVISITVLVAMSRFTRKNRRIWRDMLTIGFIASIVYLFEPNWTPSGLLQGISETILADQLSIFQPHKWLAFERFALVGCLLIGMFYAAYSQKLFKLQIASFNHHLFHILSGILMGIGAVIAGGGNDSQLLIGLPALSPASFASILSMMFGIFVGLKMKQRLISQG